MLCSTSLQVLGGYDQEECFIWESHDIATISKWFVKLAVCSHFIMLRERELICSSCHTCLQMLQTQ